MEVGVRTWGKCCYMYMKLVTGRFVVSYYVCVCGGIMYTINISHVYVLVCTIPGYGNYKLGTKLNGRLKIKLNRCHKVVLECWFFIVLLVCWAAYIVG